MKQISQRLILSCFSCNTKKGKFLLCEDCRKDPLLIEGARTKNAKSKNTKVFKALYSKEYPSIKNVNTQKFWDVHFTKTQSLKDQDLMTKEKLDILASLLPPCKTTLLDLGFGQGYFEELLFLKRNDDFYGIDISSSAVKRAEKRFKGNFIKGDVLKIKNAFSNKKFDVIVAIELIEHISPQKILGFFTDIYSLLKPRGYLLISTPINEHLERMQDNPSGHVRAYTPEVLQMELELSGFRVEKTKTLYAFKSRYKFKKLLARVFRNRWEGNNLVVKAVRI